MRLGIFSDVHANIEAMTAVMEAYRREKIAAFLLVFPLAMPA